MTPSRRTPKVSWCFSRCLTSTSTKKPIYVTTPIFYVNASPHLGHIYSMLLADTKVRWERLNCAHKTFFLTGTDEHGLKIQAAAEKEGVDPKTFVDRVSQNFKSLASAFQIDADRFIRTTDTDHIEAVQYFWRDMVDKGLIYKGSHSGWYSISDEAFYPESQTTFKIDKKTGAMKRVSTETGSEVIYNEEINYFFKLGQFQAQLIEFLEKNPTFIHPEQKYRELVASLRNETLEDLSVSRPSSRLKWGIAVPEDETQRIYVWFDALVNYLTAAGYPHHSNCESIWPANTHIVGKDITRFHCVYWPIFLMAAGVELPKQVLVHSHWLCEGVKMSKSLGNVVDPFTLAEVYGTDPTRFYLMENASIGNDCKFSEREIETTHTSLVNKWANICSRVGGSKFNLEESVSAQGSGKFKNIDEVIQNLGLDNSAKTISLRDKLVSSINSLYADMDNAMQNYGQMRALQRWWETVEMGNEFFQHCEPWRYQSLSQSDKADCNANSIFASYAVYLCAEAGRVTSICVSPFMPNLATKFLQYLSIPHHRITKEYCSVGADLQYGKRQVGQVGQGGQGSSKVMSKLKK